MNDKKEIWNMGILISKILLSRIGKIDVHS